MIDRRTFQRWMKDDSSFRTRVEAARRHYSERTLPQLRKYATEGLRRSLKACAEGQELVTTSTTESINPRTGEVVTLETVHRKPVMVPINQAFAYVMGKEIDLIGWLSQGVVLGVLPNALVEELSSEVNGLHDRIRELLGGVLTPSDAQTSAQSFDPSVAIAAALGLSNGSSDRPSLDADAAAVSSGGVWGEV